MARCNETQKTEKENRMNAHVKTEVWADPKTVPAIDGALLERWQSATHTIAREAAKHGWKKSEVARRADIAIGTFSGWYDGTYKGRYDTTTAKIENFLKGFQAAFEAAAALPTAPGFVQTRVARELFEMFTYAQALPTMAVATIRAGMGKTQAAKEFQKTRPHVFHVELSPSSQSPHMLKTEIADALGIDGGNAVTLKSKIVNALRRDGFSALLIVDEAQNLTEDCINELRHFRDVAGCGLVLLGNNEVTTPYASSDVRHASPQVSRRIGHRLSIMKPYAEDITAFLDAWQLTDDDLRKVATAVARKPGALGALDETIKAASMIARGQRRSLIADDLRAAYQRRGGGAV